jgi:AcrR family transcriptional regulator
VNTARSYTSPLRAEQAAATRDRIIAAAVELLAEEHGGDPAMPEVAERAGVSVRTAYRHFATRDDLLDAVVAWIGEQITRAAGPPPTAADEYTERASELIHALYDLEPLYRALFATPAGRASHRRGASARQDEIRLAFAGELAAMDPERARLFAALVQLVTSSTGVFFLKDYPGLSADEVARALVWATAALASAARDPEQREQL